MYLGVFQRFYDLVGMRGGAGRHDTNRAGGIVKFLKSAFAALSPVREISATWAGQLLLPELADIATKNEIMNPITNCSHMAGSGL